MWSCLHDTGKEIYTTFQHMKGASFCIHRTCLCHWVFELPLSHLSPCSAIHFIFVTLGMDGLSPPQRRLCRLWALSLLCNVCPDQDVRGCLFKFNNPSSSVLCVLWWLKCFPLDCPYARDKNWWFFWLAHMIWPHYYISFSCFFSSSPIYPWDEKPWSRPGTHSSAKVWGSCCPFSDIRVVQGWEKVSLVCATIRCIGSIILSVTQSCESLSSLQCSFSVI